MPIAAGGTGFYLQALIYDIDFKENEGESAVRQELEQIGEQKAMNSYIKCCGK